MYIFVDPGKSGWYFSPMSGPLLFIAGMISIISGGVFDYPLASVSTILGAFVFPVFTYIISCLIYWGFTKFVKK